MKKILISLDENAYQDFLNSSKKYEYRKRWPNQKVIAYIYVKNPRKSILAKMEFDNPIYKEKECIARIAEKENKEWYRSTLDYFSGKKYGYAIRCLKIVILKSPKSLSKLEKWEFTHLKTILICTTKRLLN